MANRRHRLAQRRKTVGFTQEELAERLGVDPKTVRRWERGEAETGPQPGLRPKLAHHLQVSAEQLDELLSEAVIAEETPSALNVDEQQTRNLDGPVADYAVEPWELADALTRSMVSITALEHMERAVLGYAARYPSTPPTALLPAVHRQTRLLRDVLGQPQRLRVRQQSVVLLGVLSGLAGNLWMDLGDEDRAAGFFDVAELTGEEA